MSDAGEKPPPDRRSDVAVVRCCAAS